MKKVIFSVVFIINMFSLYGLWILPDSMELNTPLPIEEKFIREEWNPYLDFNFTSLYYFSGMSGINNLTGKYNELYVSMKDTLYIIRNHKIEEAIHIPFGAKATLGRRDEIYFITQDNYLIKRKKNKEDTLGTVDSLSLIAGFGRRIYIKDKNGIKELKNDRLIDKTTEDRFPVVDIGGKTHFIKIPDKTNGAMLVEGNILVIARKDGLYYKVAQKTRKKDKNFPPGSFFILYENDKIGISDINGITYSLKGDTINVSVKKITNKLKSSKDTLFIDDKKIVIPLFKEAVKKDNYIYVLLWDGSFFVYTDDILEQMNGKFSKYHTEDIYWYYPVITAEGKNIVKYLSNLILSADDKYKDEIYYTLSFLPFKVLQAMYRLNSLDIVYKNAELIYKMADTLKYVKIKEKNNFTTLIYEDSIVLPESLYYSTVVFPMVIHEVPAYIDTVKMKKSSNVLIDSSNVYKGNGVFWREYFTKDRTYGKSFLDIALECDNVDSVVHKVHRFTNYKTGFLDFGYKTVDVQPVVIYLRHYGSCGEHSAFSTAILRTLLIPVWPVGSHGEDHVWAEYWKNGWHHWDLASDENKAFDNPEAEDMGGKGVTIVYATTYPGHIIDRTSYYRKTAQLILKGFSGERLYFLSNWNNSQSMAYWKDLSSEDTIYSGYQKNGVYLETDNKRYLWFPIVGEKTMIRKDKENIDIKKVFTLDKDPITTHFVISEYLRDSIGYTGTELVLFAKESSFALDYKDSFWNIEKDNKNKYKWGENVVFSVNSDTAGMKYPFIIINGRKKFLLNGENIIPAILLGDGDVSILIGNKEEKIDIESIDYIKGLTIRQDNPEDPFSAEMILGPYHLKDHIYLQTMPLKEEYNDIDLFLYKDSNNNGILDRKDKRIFASTTPTDKEKINGYLEEGDYFIILHGWKIKNEDKIDLYFFKD